MPPPTMIRGARLFDGSTLRQGRGVGVLVADGRITDVDLSGTRPPDGARVVELGDVTLLPGLVDAHVHLGFDPRGNVVEQMLHDSDAVLLQRMHEHAQAALRRHHDGPRSRRPSLPRPRVARPLCR